MIFRISWFRTYASNIREFFWPLLEKETEAKDKKKLELELVLQDENLDLAYALKSKILDAEEDRRKGIETKAALFISTISVASSIVVAANTLITNSNTSNLSVRASVIVSFILSVYAVRTVWFAVKALERGNYSVLGIADINFSGSKTEYQKHLIQALFNKKMVNQRTINSKVDNLTMAQEYYKRAIIVICIYSFLVLIFCFLSKKEKSEKKDDSGFRVELLKSAI